MARQVRTDKKFGAKLRLSAKGLACVALLSTLPASAWAVNFSQSAHGDKASVPKGCGSCHVGHGKERTPMLPASEEEHCYECHGGSARAEKARKANRMKGAFGLADISREFRKLSHHPIEISAAHSPREHTVLPVSNPRRHAECVDCHHHHRTERKGPPVARGGTAKKRSSLDRADLEHSLCYRCHGKGSITAPLDETTDPEGEFDLGNPSFHPVEGRGTNTNVPSLIRPWIEESLMNCTDCHSNNEVRGPSGPHGSIYEPILVRYFNQEDNSPESEFQYSLCYGCHARSSILADRSFTKHNLHIVQESASCHACHNAHGSAFYTHLIFFNRQIVSPSSSGRLEFIDGGNLRGECFLTCHGKDHNPLSYP